MSSQNELVDNVKVHAPLSSSKDIVDDRDRTLGNTT